MSLMDYFREPPGLKNLTPEDVEKIMQEGSTKVIDVRTEMEYRSGHIPNIEHIPLSEIKKRLKDLGTDENYLFVCATGHRSRKAAWILNRKGYRNISHLSGGMGAWKAANKKIETHRK
ncbi:MAG: rhodanese-like domain-containing protein [Candidatus Thermoplasmatota archaeon]|jgi:SulP family sulfate permease|nr:rhodanese-like domain-containing protein [Candidatus Thermoplasmatota archaeon]